MLYDWILFDADHTVFDFDKSAEKSIIETLKELDIDLDRSLFPLYRRINHQVWTEFENGQISRETLKAKRFRQFFDAVGIDADPVLFNTQYLQKLPYYPFYMKHAVQVLSQLSETHSLGLITNGLKEVQRPRLNRSIILKYFEVVVISGEIGHVKPEKAYFDFVFEEMGHPDKERVLVVGDSLNADIRGGINYGTKTCWFNPKYVPNDSGIIPDFEIHAMDQLPGLCY
jgi:YjjG family noncanonical pyrimidine nucleotidase